MFKFNKVMDRVNKKSYMVVRAIFAGDQYDLAPDGVNWYQVQLDPEDLEEAPFPSVDVIISNDGHIQISRDFHGERYRERYDELLNVAVSEAITIEAVLDEGTLYIPDAEESLVFHEVHEAAELKHLTNSQVYLIEDVQENEMTAIRIVFKWLDHEQELHIQENGMAFLSDRY